MDPRAETLRQQYQLRFSGLQEYRMRVWKVLCRDYFSRFIPRESAVLDLGAGWGEFISNVTAAKKIAMDLNPATGECLPQDVLFLHQDCSQPWQVASDSLDVIFTSNFLEHLPDKLAIERTVCEAQRCLKDGGIFICMGPNVKYLPGAYWDFWDHHVPLTGQSCAELLRMKGFYISYCVDRFLPYTMSDGSTPPLFLIRLYLKLSVAWPLLGKQFLVMGRKSTPGTEKATS